MLDPNERMSECEMAAEQAGSECSELLVVVSGRIDELESIRREVEECGDDERMAFFEGRLREAQWMNNVIYEKMNRDN